MMNVILGAMFMPLQRSSREAGEQHRAVPALRMPMSFTAVILTSASSQTSADICAMWCWARFARPETPRGGAGVDKSGGGQEELGGP